MFKNLTENFNKIVEMLKSKGVLTEADIDNAMREIRLALLEADVSLPVVKKFINQVKEKAKGEDIIKSISAGQMVVKIVQDELTEILGSKNIDLELKNTPSVIMMVGLQGSGKTTSSAKLAHFLRKKMKKNPIMASLDVQRPGAQKQLEVLAKQININSLEIIEGQKPVEITKRTLKEAKSNDNDVIILDTAGRLHIDAELMQELKEIKSISNPDEILLVADSMTGQDAVNVAKSFNEDINVTGIILTRADGDARGGAALSMLEATQKPIKFLGVGEKTDELEQFHPERVATRILDMGDIVSLVEKAAENVDKAEAEKLAKKLRSKSGFDFNDLAKQLRTIKKMGGVTSMMGMIPGINKMQDKMGDVEDSEQILKRQEAIISSMTISERTNPKLLNGSRKRRIAKGSGMEVQDVNRLIKQFMQMNKMMKKLGNMDKKSLMRGGLSKLFS